MRVKRLLTSVLVLLSIAIFSCKKDGASTTTGDGSNPSNPANCEDPEGTIVANLRNDSGYLTILNGGLKMNNANNFVFNDQSFHERTFVNIGEVDGLGCVENIPQSGWSDQVAVIPGNGYIVRDKYDYPEYEYTKYARIYVTSYLLSANNNILGAELKYQDNWKSLLNVATASITNISATSATCGGVVTDDGGYEVTARGVCWSASPNPTINDSHTTDGTGTGSFASNITGLTPYTTYYVRAYATNSKGTAYGEQKTFIAAYTFSVSSNERVYFSKGNLQYRASTDTWRFAENQWDYIGNGNSNISSYYSGWIDLFGWGTGDNPTYSSTNSGDYPTFNDWGNNSISNGGGGNWRTLTRDEWRYVFRGRNTSSGIRFAKAKVNGVNGMILLPDDWSASYHSLINTNNGSASYNGNIITQAEWEGKFESHGAVFLPAAGRRLGTDVDYVGSHGYYWSATYGSSDYAYYVSFDDSDLDAENWSGRRLGRSVRLVSPAGN